MARISHPELFYKKSVLRNFAKFTGEHLCWILFFTKFAGLRPATLLKMRLWHRRFPVSFVKSLRTPFLKNTSRGLLLYGFSLSKLEKLSSASEEYKEASLDNKLESLIAGCWNLLKDIWILIIANLKTFSLAINICYFIFWTLWRQTIFIKSLYFQMKRAVRELKEESFNMKLEKDLYNVNNYLYEDSIWIQVFSSMSRICSVPL